MQKKKKEKKIKAGEDFNTIIIIIVSISVLHVDDFEMSCNRNSYLPIRWFTGGKCIISFQHSPRQLGPVS